MINSAEIINFGHNLRFKPKYLFTPASEAELISILQNYQTYKIRVVGSRHAWSDAIQTEDVLIDLRLFNQVQIDTTTPTQVTVGAGCQLKTLLAQLNQQGLTLPTLGLITEQTIGGAIATATHGCGKHSLSHYVQSIRLACFDATGTQAQIIEISDGVALQAARCGLGCLGVVISVTLPCIPQYFIREKATPCATIAEVMALEAQSPLQQFFLIPHLWTYFVQERALADVTQRQGGAALYQIYWFCFMDVGLHLLIKTFAAILRSRGLIHLLFRSILPSLVFPNWVVTDRSDRLLVMEHELFRHFELEVFVLRSQLEEAVALVIDLLQVADDPTFQVAPESRTKLESVQLLGALDQIKGCYTHHYPICIRRVLPDDTLISMTASSTEDWYSLSFITYTEPRDNFMNLVDFLSKSLSQLFQARIHWGKWFPMSADQVGRSYPQLATFRAICRQYDPNGVFRNAFVTEKLGF